MGLFFNELDQKVQKRGTKHWMEDNSSSLSAILQGQFIQIDQTSRRKSNLEFSLNNEKIFLKLNSQIKSLELCLTGLEESFYLQNGKRVYEIRLVKQNLITKIYTYDEKMFTDFYCHLAKFCILKNFQKHFRVLKELGQGSFSVVYQGKNIFSNSQVALKVFDKKKLSSMQDGISVLKNQIVTLQRLKKFNLSPLIETYQTQDCVVLVLKKAECGNMIDYIKQHAQQYDERMAQSIMKKVFQNLSDLHAAGFIHRDIKPQNILFDSHLNSFHLFLTDFGLTIQKNSSKNIIGKKSSGTLGFVAPQVLHSDQYDQKCDIFSAGCILYFMMTGKSLFPNMNIAQIINLTQTNDYIMRKVNYLSSKYQKGKNLLKLLLKIDPQQRISAQDALNHPFFNDGLIQKRQKVSKLYGHDIEQTVRQYIIKKMNNFWK